MPRIHFCLLRLLLTFLLCSAASPAVAGARADEPHWIRISSGHFSVVTDADEKKGRDVVVRFEQMRAVFGLLLARDRINLAEPLDIIALKSDDEYSRVVPNRQGLAMAAFFVPGEDRNYFVLNLSQEESWRAISYDFARVFLNYNYPPTQPWFDEGFAQYFASLRLDDKQGQIGESTKSFTERLSAPTWLAIPDLFTTRSVLSAGPESCEHGLFCAQSWIVMHYLLNRNQLPETGTYFDLVENQRLPVEEAIQKAYGMSSAQFGPAVKDYFHSLAMPSQAIEKGRQPEARSAGGIQSLAVIQADQVGSSMGQIPEAQAQALVAEMTVRLSEHREQAMQTLEGIAGQPKTDNVIARRGLAWAHMEKKEFKLAVEELGKGAELAPRDPWLHFYSALARQRAIQTGGQGTEELPNMMQDLQQVLNWDPEFAEARNMLAMAQLEGGGVHAAMDSMRAAIRLDPRNQNYLLHMAEIYMAGKNWDAATAMLDRLKGSPDSQIAKAAREQLEGLPMLKKFGVMPEAEAKTQQTAPVPSPSSSATSATSSPSPARTARKPEPQAKPREQTRQSDEEAGVDSEAPTVPPQPDRRPIQFVKGKLVAVDCSQAPSATLTVSAGARVLKLRTENYKLLMVMGADGFSCEWTGRPVAVNYRFGGKADGDLVSLELE
jgi:tetratricopeptide (TPR) repeat protein